MPITYLSAIKEQGDINENLCKNKYFHWTNSQKRKSKNKQILISCDQ